MKDPDNYNEELNFGDFLSTQRINEVLQYSTDKKINQAKYSKHIRAVVDTVNGDFASIVLRDDTHLGDPTYTIYNVKIRDGLDLKYGDNVYVQYINNNSNNMFIDFKVDQLELMFDLYDKKRFKIIDTFQTNTGWISGAGTQSNDLINRKLGNKGLKILENDNVASTLYSEKSGLTLNLTVFDDSTTATISDNIFLAFYVSDDTLVNSITLTFTTSVGNYYYYVYSSFSTGWNLIKTSKALFTSSGGPNWNSITKIKLEWSSKINAKDSFITFGALYLVQSDYMVLTSPDGTRYRIVVDNVGAISGSAI